MTRGVRVGRRARRLGLGLGLGIAQEHGCGEQRRRRRRSLGVRSRGGASGREGEAGRGGGRVRRGAGSEGEVSCRGAEHGVARTAAAHGLGDVELGDGQLVRRARGADGGAAVAAVVHATQPRAWRSSI